MTNLKGIFRRTRHGHPTTLDEHHCQRLISHGVNQVVFQFGERMR